ncbi:MAG: heme A synthase [Flavobacteriales bacterium]|nr:MAG: heme A synthase [Flavobacteriales bacterium]
MENKPNTSVILWLLCGCFLIFLMVVIGGITRLTYSGLSMVEWHLFMGAIPPLNEQDWNALFQKYQQFPEFKELNYAFTVNDFKTIFWWEYIHRMLGRLIGLVFIVPFFWFMLKKKLSPKLTTQLGIIFLLGAFQGFLGWFMVKSGLNKEPSVSHYRLAAHLITAFAAFGYTFWVALGLKNSEFRILNSELKKLKKWVYVLFGILIVQIIYGAFVAGMKAGIGYNTFPKMGDEWIASNAFSLSPFWLNLFENKTGVQFIHRCMAYLVVIFSGIAWWKSRKMELPLSLKTGFNVLSALVLLQFLLGVLTLLNRVPLSLALLHQLGAFLLFGTLVFLMHRLKSATSQ